MGIVEFYRSLTPAIQSTIWVTLFLILVIVLLRIKMRNYSADKPAKGIILLCESFVKMMNGFTKGMLGKRWRALAPYFITLGVFLFVANISGLFGFTPPTVSLSVTFSLGLITFFLIQIFGMKANGVGAHLKDLCSPVLMAPMNIIGEIAVPVSLAIRLFGNILSGSILTILLYSFLGWAAVVITPPIHAIFDVVFGFIQTFIFVMLTAVNIGNKFSESEFEI
ncbi:MAG: F0F1 ATP synthase subunit A [Bacilli bacterium]|nr:F0F1 ATP synthase subunit A [Bacilli bacterium]